MSDDGGNTGGGNTSKPGLDVNEEELRKIREADARGGGAGADEMSSEAPESHMREAMPSASGAHDRDA